MAPLLTTHSDAIQNAILPVFKPALKWLASLAALPTGSFAVSNSPEMPDTGSYLVMSVSGSTLNESFFAGQLAWRFSDGTVWQRAVTSTGFTTWAMVGQNTWNVLSCGATGWPTTSASEVALVTVPIPAGMLGPNGIIRVTTLWTFTGSASKTPRVRLGAAGAGIAGTQMWGVGQTTNTVDQNQTMIGNRNNQAVQIAFINSANSFSATTGTQNPGAINTANASEICLTGVTNGSESLTLESYIVEVCFR